MTHLLIVEDEATLLDSLDRGLTEEGYSVHTASTFEDACRIAEAQPVDAVLLDLMLPDRHGFQLLHHLRSVGMQGPILIVTALDAVEDRIRGLDSGADDYLVKPFSFEELLARLRALLRRTTAAVCTRLRFRDLEMDLLARHVERGGVEIPLTPRQFELLHYLLRHSGEVLSREAIARDVWKEPTATWTNVIEVQVNQLRKRIESEGSPPVLHTVRGQGYLLGDSP